MRLPQGKPPAPSAADCTSFAHRFPPGVPGFRMKRDPFPDWPVSSFHQESPGFPLWKGSSLGWFSERSGTAVFRLLPSAREKDVERMPFYPDPAATSMVVSATVRGDKGAACDQGSPPGRDRLGTR